MAKEYLYHAYKVKKNGTIISPLGEPLTMDEKGCVKVIFDGKKHIFLAGRVVYEAVTGDTIGRNKVVLFKDGNCNNPAFDNIKVITRKEYFAGHDWSCIYKASKEERKKILEDRQGGMSIRKLADKYKLNILTIQKIIRSEP